MNNDNSDDIEEPNIKNVTGHVTFTSVKGNSNTTNVSVSGDIKVEKNIVSNLDPEFQKSIADFTQVLKKEFEGRTATAEQITSLNNRINELAKEFEGVKKGQDTNEEKIKMQSVRA